MYESVQAIFRVTEGQMDAFMDLFVSRLPGYMQEVLKKAAM